MRASSLTRNLTHVELLDASMASTSTITPSLLTPPEFTVVPFPDVAPETLPTVPTRSRKATDGVALIVTGKNHDPPK